MLFDSRYLCSDKMNNCELLSYHLGLKKFLEDNKFLD